MFPEKPRKTSILCKQLKFLCLPNNRQVTNDFKLNQLVFTVYKAKCSNLLSKLSYDKKIWILAALCICCAVYVI